MENMKKWIVAIHSAHDGDGEAIQLFRIFAEDEQSALCAALKLPEGTIVDEIDLPDMAWSKPVLCDSNSYTDRNGKNP